MAGKKPQAPKQPKGDPNKQFDVIINVVHDDRHGKCQHIDRERYSFATEEEAVAFANKLKEVNRG